MSTSQSALPKRNAKRHQKLTKKNFTISPFFLDTPTEGSSAWGTRLSSHVINVIDIMTLKN